MKNMVENQPLYRTFEDREMSRMGHLVHKIKAKDSTGEWAYYFVLVEEQNEQGFMVAISGDGMIDLEHYGTVIASIYGEEPSEELKNFLKEKYDFDV